MVTAWVRSGIVQSATLDAAPPAFTAVDVPATGTVGQPIAMASATLDTWSALAAGQPAWTFGDGASAAGASVSHVFTSPGTYIVSVAAIDAVGNASAPVNRQILITSPPIPPLPATTVTTPKMKITWKSGKLSSSTLTLTGTVGAPAKLTLSVNLHSTGKGVLRSTFDATAGAWTRTLKLPASFAPGTYDVMVAGPVVRQSQTSFTLAPPVSGIVKRSYATAQRRGPTAVSLSNARELWAHFSFSALPKRGQKITTKWILPNGKRLAANLRPRSGLVEAQVKDLSGKALPTGRWRCVITVGKTVLATLNVRLR